jgi:hypothetical protein
MKTLICIQTEFLPDDVELPNNLIALRNEVVYRVKDLDRMTEVLTGISEIKIIA